MEGSDDEDKELAMSSIVGVGLAIVYWVGSSVLVGFAAARMSVPTLSRLGQHQWWLGGPSTGWYRHVLHIDAWKDHLPEAGRFGGGVSKRHLTTRDRSVLVRMYLETIRAEVVHTLLLLTQWVPLVWLHGGFVVVPAVYTVGANLPFVAVQRYNRKRLSRLVSLEHGGSLDK